MIAGLLLPDWLDCLLIMGGVWALVYPWTLLWLKGDEMNETTKADLAPYLPKPAKQQYLLVEDSDAGRLSRKVEDLLANGWVLHGPPTSRWDGHYAGLCQAVVKTS